MLPYRRVPVASPLPLGPLFDGEPIARPPASRRTGLCRPRAIRGRGTNHGPQTQRRGLRYQRRTADPKAGSALPTTDGRPEGGVCATNDGPQTRRRGLQLPTTNRRPKGGVCATLLRRIYSIFGIAPFIRNIRYEIKCPFLLGLRKTGRFCALIAPLLATVWRPNAVLSFVRPDGHCAWSFHS